MGMPSGAYSSQDYIPEGYDKFQVGQYTPQQMKLHSEMFQHAGPNSYLSKLASGNQNQFAEMEAPALRQFNALQGSTASRFSGMGMGARNSSGFQNTMSAASQDFAGQLQSNRQKLQRQAIMDLMGLSNSLLGQRPYERGLAQEPQEGDESSGWGGIIGTGVGAVGGGIAGFYAGDPYHGALLGASVGNKLGSAF